MRLLLTSAGITNTNIDNALVDLLEDVPLAVEFRGGGPRSDGQAVTSIDASLVGVGAASE